MAGYLPLVLEIYLIFRRNHGEDKEMISFILPFFFRCRLLLASFGRHNLSLTLGGNNIFLYNRKNAVFTISRRFDAKYLAHVLVALRLVGIQRHPD